MDRLFVFIIHNDIWIYILCILGAIWYLSELLRARRNLRGAMFGLERERGQSLQRRAAALFVFFVAIILFVTYVNLQVAPTLPADLLKPPTPTPNIFATPFSSPAIPGQVEAPGAPTLDVAPTVTLPGNLATMDSSVSDSLTNVPIEEATEIVLPDISIGNCAPELTITTPPSGITVTGSVTFFGTVNPEELGFFDLNIYGPATEGRWFSLFEVLKREPIVDGILTTVDFLEWQAGTYIVRLTATTLEGVDAGQCAIQLTLE